MIQIIIISILSVLCVALLFDSLFCFRSKKATDVYIRNLFIWLDEERKKASQWEERFRTAEQINRKDFVLFGEILHTVTYYTEKENFKYADLINSIGKFVRACKTDGDGRYLEDQFFSGTRFSRLDTRKLTQAERDAVDNWFECFANNPDRNPLKLLLLAFELMCCDDIGTALKNTETDPNGYTKLPKHEN